MRSVAIAKLATRYQIVHVIISPFPPSIHTAASQTVPVITEYPTGGVYSLEDSISLTCGTNSVNIIRWYRDDEFVESGAEYRIASFSEVDEGTYRCRATINGVGTVTSAVATLQLAGMCYRTIR